LILLSVLAIIGINATKSIATNRIKIEKITGWMLIVIGAFLIINGLPGGHEWYEETFIHKGWNELVEQTTLPGEFEMDEHEHEDDNEGQLAKESMPIILSSMIGGTIIWYLIKGRKTKEVAA